jgi:ferric-dicitrate binding protein FerR (iron transport regulator)
MKPERLNYLFQNYFDKTATEKERDELMQIINDPLQEEVIKSLMEDVFMSNTSNNTGNDVFAQGQKEKMLEAVFAVQDGKPESRSAIVKNLVKTSWIKYAAVAILLLSVGLYFFKVKQTGFDTSRAKISNDIKPGGNNAILTLSNGTRIILNDAKNGKLAVQGSASVVKLASGELKYNQNGVSEELPVYNTMSTPRGGQYKLQLPDGTVVMLNSESSITFPIAFKGKVRNVSLTGEAYFEVAKNKKMPFHVSFGDQQVEVLGTHFNISAYKDQPDYKTTLLEGSVRISKGKENHLLVPGQQAIYKSDSKMFVVNDVDTEDVIAWKNGLFQFDNTELDQVMLQLSRWYNVEVEYDGPKPVLNFTGAVKRDNNLSRVIKILESTGGIKFTIDGNKIIVHKK